MNKLFKNKINFTIVFVSILIIDLVIKDNLDSIFFRYLSKSLIMISLIIFYLVHQKEKQKRNLYFMSAALFSFLLGDIFLINYEEVIFYILGVFLFILGKLFYVFRFSNQKDFKLLDLLPFFGLSFIYMFFIMHLVIDNLGSFLIPVFIYLFICLMLMLFAFLRWNEVNRESYILVTVGVFLSVINDSVTVLQSFYDPNIIPHYDIFVMLVYGVSQYLIVLGIIKETQSREVITAS
jgi:hypothetical protein